MLRNPPSLLLLLNIYCLCHSSSFINTSSKMPYYVNADTKTILCYFHLNFLDISGYSWTALDDQHAVHMSDK